MQRIRPTDNELFKRIQEAKQALDKNAGLFANPAKAVGELYALHIGETNELWLLLKELLKEISPKDYAGGNPPARSYEKAIANQELFAFAWQSNLLNKEMYLKFALRNGRYYYVSLHVSAKEEEQLETSYGMSTLSMQ